MTKLNISQAAKVAGVARVTVQRHIKQGKLSCEVNGQGQKLIDTSELVRAYGELQPLDTSDTVKYSSTKIQHEAPLLQQRISDLERQIKVLEELSTGKDSQIDDFKKREEKWDIERDKFWQELTTKNLMLEDLREREKEVEKPSSDRWLVWGLGIFTLIIGVTAMVAVYYLLQSGA